MKKTKIKRFLVSAVALAMSFVFSGFGQVAGEHGDAEYLDTNQTYSQTFTISAYYSPLPCQNRYATGSYSGDIRLNGSGVNSADGTPVYPGMVAAPKTYAFGTKMHIPGIGIVAVHDRGGAIVTAGNRGHAYDRLDIWMGWGDEGLSRALNWGKRDVNVTVYGITDSVIEDIYLDGFSYDEAEPGECTFEEESLSPVLTDSGNSQSNQVALDGAFNYSMSIGDSGEHVVELQKELSALNYYGVEPSGVFDELTEHAVFKFQQARGILAANSDLGAGVFGPQTRNHLNSIVASRKAISSLIAEKSGEISEKVAGF